MELSTNQAEHFRPRISRIMTALAVALVIGSAAMTPALADNDHHDKGWHKGERKGEWHGDRDRHDYYYRPQYQHPYYSPPVYVPPPVYYAPQQSPGISFFFPLDIRVHR